MTANQNSLIDQRQWFALFACLSLFSLNYFATGDLGWLSFLVFLSFLRYLWTPRLQQDA